MGKNKFNQDPGPLKRFEPKSKPLPKPRTHLGLNIAVAVVFTTLVLQVAGVIDLTGLLNPDSPKYLDVPAVFNPEHSTTTTETTTENENWWTRFLSLFNKKSKFCPKTTAEMSTPCCKQDKDNQDINYAQTSIVEVAASCNACPSDTTRLGGFAPHTPEFTAKYGQYLLCECKPCPE